MHSYCPWKRSTACRRGSLSFIPHQIIELSRDCLTKSKEGPSRPSTSLSCRRTWKNFWMTWVHHQTCDLIKPTKKRSLYCNVKSNEIVFSLCFSIFLSLRLISGQRVQSWPSSLSWWRNSLHHRLGLLDFGVFGEKMLYFACSFIHSSDNMMLQTPLDTNKTSLMYSSIHSSYLRKYLQIVAKLTKEREPAAALALDWELWACCCYHWPSVIHCLKN